MRLLITGEHGYIASRLAEYLRKKQPEWEIAQISVREEEWMKRSFRDTDVLIHTAGIVHQNGAYVSVGQYREVNVRLTVRLAEKCRREGVSQFIFLSTMSVYGMEQGVIGFDSVPNPSTLYGRSKWKAEQLLLEKYADAGVQGEADNGSKLVITIVRPPMIYGRGCPGNYERLSKLAQKTPVFPKTGNRRSMLYIDNLCECLYELAKQKRSGIFFPQDAEYVNTSSLVCEIAGCHGHKCTLISGMGAVVNLMMRCFGSAGKVFGSLVYEKEMSVIPGISYQITPFRMAVSRTEGVGKPM